MTELLWLDGTDNLCSLILLLLH